MFREIQKKVDQALGRIRLPFRIKITAVRSGGGIQTVSGQGLNGEPVVDAEHFEQFGVTSVPPPGTTGIAIPLGGKTSHTIVVATEHAAYRMVALQSGEMAIYSSEGAHVVIKQGRIIEANCDTFIVNCKTWEVNAAEQSTFNTPTLTASNEMVVQDKLTGQGGLALSNKNGGSTAQIDGDLHASGDVVAGSVSTQHHKHPGDSGGTTGEAIPG